MYITNGRVNGGIPNILIFWLFLDNLSIYEQTIDRALTIHTEVPDLPTFESQKSYYFPSKFIFFDENS